MSSTNDATPAALAAQGFALFVAVAAYYVPEYLRVLGARAWLVGLFGSLTLALPLAAPTVRRIALETLGSRARVSTALASVGVLLWLAAPYLGRVSAVVVTVAPWIWVFAGLSFFAFRRSNGLGGPSALLRRTDSRGTATRAELPRRLGFLAVVGVAAGLFVGTSDFLAAYQVLLALTTSVGLTAAIAGNAFDRDAAPLRGVPAFGRVRRRLRGVPSNLRSLLIGDALVGFSVGMVAFFVVIVVVHRHRFDVTVLGAEVPSAATFALLLAVGTVVAATIPANRLADELDARTVVCGGYLSVALFPLWFVTIGNVVVAAASFACLGAYVATLPVRETVLAGGTRPHAAFRAYRLARRAVVSLAPLVGGLLYGFDPVLAFGLASCVGLLGCWEFMRYVRTERT